MHVNTDINKWNETPRKANLDEGGSSAKNQKEEFQGATGSAMQRRKISVRMIAWFVVKSADRHRHARRPWRSLLKVGALIRSQSLPAKCSYTHPKTFAHRWLASSRRA